MKIDSEGDLLRLGGKSYQLHKLMKVFNNIPPFFTIEFENSKEIKDPDIRRQIMERCESLNTDLVAVRSSASSEDGETMSFAGMFKTILNVRFEETIDAIEEVLSSVDEKRVYHYAKAHKIDHRTLHMSVIIQRMVNSRVSGVCFTRITDNPNLLIIEACLGLGELLVSGKISPDKYILNRQNLSIIKESRGYQRTKLIMSSKERVSNYQEVPFHQRNSRKLTNDEIFTIAKSAIRAENYLKFSAVDMEWAIEDHSFFILQCRPYTGLS